MLALLIIPALAYMAYIRLTRKRPFTGDMAEQKVVILGASSGIGRSMAVQYAARGAKLLLVARRQGLLEQVQRECQTMHPKSTCDIVVGDITQESVLAAATVKANSVLNGVNVLVLCAGITSVRSFEALCSLDSEANQASSGSTVSSDSISTTLIQQVFTTNLHAHMLAVKHFLPILKACKAQILVISSVAGVIPAPTRSIYTASKHALTGFFKALRIELAYSGVSVCIAFPGTVNTAFRESAVDVEVSKTESPEMTRRIMNRKQPGSMTADSCAANIIYGADRGDREIYLPRLYYFAHVLSMFMPEVMDYFAAKKYGYVGDGN
ncbi:hypothetical protein BATDEDRAFT_21723 [Batrachochytrium dendrobatidis JAM81]|uniref:Uncharacterized protein n=1 Tax=Batrachochytrium dendrobatidis (strain JAM81 / FGSC 10211) TaxID=684364 RepID=F4NUX1_BATDJ|nr:uncharacterized protein BATDEDRAFT_21723 [Batrachochytrium dendrobatidis JAM81]EGF84046.1 hypothetical protein BATDEDRAFT_21723 [Batrachochytrium dendrobatidis JAM81]KAJ8325649.1 hypothetical protein O5D80_005851 [Batrachochytrium dendrobatidis]KAK5671372.1 hypothetical protein QVD99_002090 [Batrachochytrium dendrobatidis]|eukprot:XP_006675363.1 hypothetical protein BATDEDRAFT_21723 [Batrachochytrium dendrobatidis JAM81]